VALIVAPGLADGGCLNLIREQVCAVVEVVTPRGASLRVLLNITGITRPQVGDYSAAAAHGGASLVQGGSFRGDRATFTQIEAMRDALPVAVLLKWTQPVRSVEMMLVAMALGVDRFNGDVPALLTSAKRSSEWGPLMLPIYGVDF
jgi:deoxyribose-phosphate aldolase